MNVIFFIFIFIAFVTAGWRHINWCFDSAGPSPMESLTKAVMDSASGSVELAIGLVGMMTLFLGLMKVAEAGGMLTMLARLIRPLMVRLFPEIPADHPAMGSMILNLSANVMGLGNAATPFGIRAMQELNRLNKQPGTATNAMVLFIAINTSNITLLPTGVIALRAAAGSSDPAGILPTTLFATTCSTVTAIIAAKLLARSFIKKKTTKVQDMTTSSYSSEENEDIRDESPPGYPGWISTAALGLLISLIPITIFYGKAISPWIIPALILGFLCFGVLRRVHIYEVFVEGAKEGFQVAIRIIPFLVAILVAVGMLRASGAMDAIVGTLGVYTQKIGLPAEGLTMALIRTLSGSGAYAVLASVINNPAIGPDSYTGYLVSTIQGSTETTFYVLAVYFGAVQIRRLRHALAAALIADLAGVIGSVLICSILFK
ncbi:Transporter gate domain protein [uncultured Desulfobacterium sp.]|uniref:Transporter gate domain protein n=1 Tax=uncultured Desulfobacterium sp. TaxID=201089 RepID=A0A445N464_9BACT|nr:Transporter gate domain protein [uncultured Desulfobacterium sp.]